MWQIATVFIRGCGVESDGKGEIMGRPSNDITGQNFGSLTAVSRYPFGATRGDRWSCVCSGGGVRCKGQTVVRVGELLKGQRSCGCLSVRSAPLASPGDMFGRWRVVSQKESIQGRPRWLCVCSCPEATEKIIEQRALRRGATKSCGCYAREQTSAYNEHKAFLSRLRSEAEAQGAAVDF